MQEMFQSGGSRPKRMTKKQIQEMVKNMRKGTIVQEAADKYHKKEEKEAESILQQLDEN